MLKKFLTALAFSTALTLATPATVSAAPVFGAVAAFAATPLGGIVVNAALGIGASLLSNMLSPHSSASSEQKFGIQLSMRVGGDNPIEFPVGYTATAGQLLYPGTWGQVGDTPNAYAVWEVQLSDLPTPDRPVIWVNEQRCTIDWTAAPTAQGYPVTEFRRGGVDYLWVQFDNGTQTTPSSYMRSKFAGHSTRPYTDDMVGVGLAKVRVTALANRELWTGSPSFLFETTGIPLYNVAKDSSVGGSGAHRWNNPGTWEPSSNPIVIAYNIRRGIFYGGQWVYGGNNKKPLSAYRLPASNWIAAINACDTLINLSGGGTEKQFRAGGVVSADMQPVDVINQLLASCNARMAEVGGIYKVQVGAPGAAVYAFSDEHIVITDGQTLDPFPGLDDTHNAIEATYPEPGEKWGTKDAPGRYNPIWEEEDGGRQLVAQVTYPMVPYRYQVQRLMATAVKDARRFRNHSLTLPPDAWLLEPNDVVAWTSPRNGYLNKKFLVTAIAGKRGYNQVVALKEVDPSDHDWNPATDQVPVTIGDLVIERPPPQLMTGWQALPAVMVDNDGASRRPSIEVRYDGHLSDVRAVRVQVRVLGDTGLAYDADQPYDPAEATPARILNGVFLPAANYEVRGKYVPFSGRVTRWSNEDEDGTEGPWLSVTTPDIRLGPLDVIYGDLDLDQLGTQLAGYLDWMGQTARDLIEQAEAQAILTGDQELANQLQMQEISRSLSVAVDDLSASFNETITTAIIPMQGELVALADALTELSAADGDDVNTARIRFTAMSGPPGYSKIGIETRFDTGNPDDFRIAGSYWETPNDPLLPTRRLEMAEQFIITDGVHSDTPFYFDGTAMRVKNAFIANLTADNIDVSTLTLDFGQIENVEIEWADIANVSVATGQIADAAITSAKIANLQVDRIKIANGAVSDWVSDTGNGPSRASGVSYSVSGTNWTAPPYPILGAASISFTGGATGGETSSCQLFLRNVTAGTRSLLSGSGRSLNAALVLGPLVNGNTYRLELDVFHANDTNTPYQVGAYAMQVVIPRK
ncbi:hypothetical protein [Devosia sp. DBB001]|nr:hypothetical protein [Devosia sp. DBB001]